MHHRSRSCTTSQISLRSNTFYDLHTLLYLNTWSNVLPVDGWHGERCRYFVSTPVFLQLLRLDLSSCPHPQTISLLLFWDWSLSSCPHPQTISLLLSWNWSLSSCPHPQTISLLLSQSTAFLFIHTWIYCVGSQDWGEGGIIDQIGHRRVQGRICLPLSINFSPLEGELYRPRVNSVPESSRPGAAWQPPMPMTESLTWAINHRGDAAAPGNWIRLVGENWAVLPI